MGADIHYIIEQEDINRHWHCLWSSRLQWSDWFSEVVLKPKNMTSMNQPYKLQDLRDRDYYLFALFSNVRGQSAFNDLKPESEAGILHQGWPTNASGPAEQMSDRRQGFHSHSWIGLCELETLTKLIEKHSKKSPQYSAKKEQFDALKRFNNNLETVVKALTGPMPLLGHVVGCLPYDPDDHRAPDNETLLDGPNFAILSGRTAHESLANIDAWTTLKPASPQTLRLLVCYDS